VASSHLAGGAAGGERGGGVRDGGAGGKRLHVASVLRCCPGFGGGLWKAYDRARHWLAVLSTYSHQLSSIPSRGVDLIGAQRTLRS
jgi:hypothetical protein